MSMPIIGHEIDAGFYRLIHQLLDAPPQDETVERRREQRKPFPTAQHIAPRRGPELPNESDFIEVRCHDLTRHGFSFFLPYRPDFDSLVVAFGTGPDAIHLAARVVNCDQVLIDSSGYVERAADRSGRAADKGPDVRTATPMILVGCCFTGRLEV